MHQNICLSMKIVDFCTPPKDIFVNTYKLKTMKNSFRILIASAVILFSTGFSARAQTVHINPATDGGFELPGGFIGNGWTVVNHTTTQWFIGAQGANASANGAYISNDGGVTNAYTNTLSQTSHFYRDVTIPAGETVILLSFDLRNVGESGWDRLLVYTAPNTTTPVAGTPASNSTIFAGATLIYTDPAGLAAFSQRSIQLSPALAGTTVRLIFTWQNDNSIGTNPPASIDNISLFSQVPAPLNGTYTIDNTMVTSPSIPLPGNFNNFNDAITYMNLHGISGPVTFNVTAGQTFTENPRIITATGTLANPIVFQKSGIGANPIFLATNGVSTTLDAGLTISGGDYITFNGINVIDNPTNITTTTQMEFGYLIRNISAIDGANKITILNCKISLNRTNTATRGILQSASATGGGFTPTNLTGSNANNSFINDTIQNAYAGIYLLGNVTYPDATNLVSGCVIGAATANDIGNGAVQSWGIRAGNQNNVTINQNLIRNVTTSAATNDGIFLEAAQGIGVVSNNTVMKLRNASTASAASFVSGIRATLGTVGTHQSRIFNNMISDITSAYTGVASATRTLKGIYLPTGGSTTSTHNVHFNSISIDASVSPNLSSVCIEIGVTTGCIMNIRSNIFANFTGAQAGIAKHYTWMSPTAGSVGNVGSVSNYNDLFIANATNGFVGLGGAIDQATLANWQAASLQDANSVSADPQYNNINSNLHTTSINVNGLADMTGITWITVDIDNQVRNSPHDIGADDFILVVCAGSVGGTITPASVNACNGQTVIMTSVGATVGIGITYQWQVSNVSGGPYANVIGGSGANTTTYTTSPLITGTYYFVLQVTCSTGPSTGYSNELTVTVNPLPTVSVTPTTGTICSPGGSPITLTASGASTYTWLPIAGLTPTTGAVVSANPTVSTNYTVTGTDINGCIGIATATITIVETPSISPVTATPSSVCSGGNSQLNVSAGTTTAYTLSNPSFSSTACLANPGPTGDDAIQGNNAIGFNFNYYGVTYTQFGISTNGNIQIGDGTGTANNPAYSTSWTDVVIPNAAVPNNMIALAWDDWFISPGEITWGVTGSAPNRRLVVCFNTTGRGSGSADTLNGQIVLEETSNIIYLNMIKKGVQALNTATQGIENQAGNASSVGVPGRQSSAWNTTNNSQVFTPSGGVITYAWTPPTFLSSTTINNPIATAVTATTSYTVTATAGGCNSTGTVTVTAGAALTSSSNITPSPTVCTGSNVTLNSVPVGGGAPYTYSWTGPNSFTSTLSNPTLSSVSATEAGTYTCTVTDACSAISVSQVTLTVNPLPVVTVTPTSATFCNPGPGVSLTASGAIAYFWGPAAGLSATTGATVIATPTVGTTYTVTGTSALGCSGNATTIIAVGLTPVVIASSTPTSVCSGGNSVLTATSSVNPTYCQPTYSTGTGSGDYISHVVLNTINNTTVGAASPYYTLFPAVGSTTTTLIAGNMYTITLTAGTYTINDIAAFIDYNQNGNLIDASEKLGETDNMAAGPVSTTFTFTVPLTALNGTTRLRVREMDHAGTNDIDPCIVQSIYGETEDYIITITGGVNDVSYTWSPGTFLSSTTGSPVNATGVTATTTYTVTGTTSAGCSASANATITVNPSPTVTTTASSDTICVGASSTLTAAGASTYSWMPGSLIGTSVIVSPATTTTYTVTGTSALGCTNTATITITVNPLPTVVANTSASAVCAGSPVTLSGSGASSYTWTGGVIDAVSFVPPSTSTYTVTGTDVNSCINTASVTVTVNALPTVVANTTASTICEGSPVTLTGSGASTYTWTGGVTDGVPFNPIVTNTYTVTGTDINSCQNTATVSVTVNPLPSVSITFPVDTVCLNGGNFALGGESPLGGTWSGTGVTGSTFDPLVPGLGFTLITYTYSDVNGCSAFDTSSLWVDVCAGVMDAVSLTNLSVFPNPSNGHFTIVINHASGNGLLEITDALGQVISMENIATVNGSASREIDLGTFASGIYFVHFTTSSESSVQKISIQR